MRIECRRCMGTGMCQGNKHTPRCTNCEGRGVLTYVPNFAVNRRCRRIAKKTEKSGTFLHPFVLAKGEPPCAS